MSVVEKAIRKLQESRQTQGEPTTTSPSPIPPARTSADSAQSGPSQGLARGPVLTIGRGMLRSAGLMPPEEDLPLLTRQYRKIKQPLIARARGADRTPKGYLIMITSAMAGEGKTFTAVNLALSMAMEKDLRVLLVDADVAKPQLSHVFQRGDSPGLLDAVRDPTLDIESLICPTDLPTLSFLPAGRPGEEATELLSSARMAQLAAQLGERDEQRVVLFDSPPLLQTTESPALAHVAGQIVVVVRAEDTPQPVVIDALKTLDKHPGVSLVLNQSVRTVTSAYYYYGYGNERAGSTGSA